MNGVTFVSGLIAFAIIFVAYRFARRRAADSTRFQPVDAWLPAGTERLFGPMLLAYLFVGGFDYVNAGALSHLDRFWIGLALGAALGALGITLAVRNRLTRK